MRKYGIVLALCAILLTGCSKNASEATSDYSNHVVPNIVELGRGNNSVMSDYYYYIIDRNTGVVYLSYDSYRRHAITVMLNADGTPVTAEQLGIDCPYNR
jgi:hypothetical protein